MIASAFDQQSLAEFRAQIESERAQFSNAGQVGAHDPRAGHDDIPWSEQMGAHFAANAAAEIDRINSRIVFIDVNAALAEPQPPRQSIVKHYLPAGIVAALNGVGASGKSYTAEMLSVAVAIGRSVKPFEIEKPGVVLFVSVEDDELALSDRLYWIAQELNLTTVEKKLLAENLRIVSARGALGPLMQFNSERNPVPAIGTEWLRQTMDEYRPDLVILDTKSRLFGLVENSNDDAAAWVSNLESLLVDHPVTSFLVISHVGKKDDDAQANQYGARGASAFVDNCRSVLAFVEANDAEKKRLRATDIGPVYKLVHAKPSYTKKMNDAFFIKNPRGVPVYLDATEARDENLGAALDELVDFLTEDKPEGANKRDLVRAEKPDYKKLRDRAVTAAGLAKAEWGDVVNFGIGCGRLIEREELKSKAGKKPITLMARIVMQKEDEPAPEQQNLC